MCDSMNATHSRLETVARPLRRFWLAPLLLTVVAACGGDDDQEEESAGALVGGTPEPVAELLSPVRAVSIAEIEAAQTAARQAAREDIRQYAATVATDHRALVGILDSVARTQGAQLMVTRAARELENTVRLAHSMTENLSGFDYDATFIRAEIEGQRQLIDRLDQELIPDAVREETQTLLRDVRTMVDAHMTRARQLLATLAQAPAEPSLPPTPTQPTTPTQTPTQPRPRPTPPPADTPTFTPTRRDSVQPPPPTGPPVLPPPPPITTSG